MITYFNKYSKKIAKIIGMLGVMCILTFICVTPIYASEIETDENLEHMDDSIAPEQMDPFEISISSNMGDASLSSTLQILLILTILTLAPSILILLTSFTRIIITLHFVRTALGLQTTPPNQVLIGLALFLTFFIMSPVFTQINENALQPLSAGTITQEEALEEGFAPIRTFMYSQITEPKDIRLFMDIANIAVEEIEGPDDVPITVLIPAFIISELRKAFIMGFMIYLPFIIIDMVVASALMSMGMMMLPPTTISMPFKILLFILADGWNLIIGRIVETFYT